MSGGNQGGISQPFGGTGMDWQKAQGILDPLGIGGGGGMNKSSAEAFFDPAGIDSGPNGLNLFGNRASTDANGAPSVLPNLGARSMMPVQPYGKFMAPDMSGGGFNAMAARGAGSLFNPSAGAPSWQALMAAISHAASTGGGVQSATKNQLTLPARRIQP